jgi:transcription elongation GreA/GreB family factor
MTLCMQVQAGNGGIIRHLGSPEDWQQILTGATTIRRVSDIPMGPYNALYQVEDSSEQHRQYIVQEPAVDGEAGERSYRVRVGSWVGIREGDSKETWRVVALEESDPMRGCISEDSPLGRALLGHMVGDVVRVRGPKGSWSVTVLAIW